MAKGLGTVSLSPYYNLAGPIFADRLPTFRILVHFARYMNKVVSNLKQTNLRKEREARRPKSVVAGGLPPQQYRGPPASVGGSPFRPQLGTHSDGPATPVPVLAQLPLCLGPAVLVSGHVPSLAPAPTPVPMADHSEPRPAKRARTSAEAWASQEEPRFEPAPAPTVSPFAGSTIAGQLLPESRARLDNLVADTVTRKRKRSVPAPWVYDVEVPADVALTYNVWVTDKSDGQFLVDGPVVIESTGQELADGGVLAHLKDSFGRQGYPPRFEISTGDGTRAVQSDLEWQQAVLSLYNSARDGCVFIVVTIYI